MKALLFSILILASLNSWGFEAEVSTERCDCSCSDDFGPFQCDLYYNDYDSFEEKDDWSIIGSYDTKAACHKAILKNNQCAVEINN